jgi:hypothetical protein
MTTSPAASGGAPRPPSLSDRPQDAEGSADRVVVRVGEAGAQFGRLLGRHPRGQHLDALLRQCGEDLFHRGDRFPLREDHLGKAATAAAIQVQLRFAEVGDRRAGQPLGELLGRQFTGQQPACQLFQFVLFHPSIVIRCPPEGNP